MFRIGQTVVTNDKDPRTALVGRVLDEGALVWLIAISEGMTGRRCGRPIRRSAHSLRGLSDEEATAVRSLQAKRVKLLVAFYRWGCEDTAPSTSEELDAVTKALRRLLSP